MPKHADYLNGVAPAMSIRFNACASEMKRRGEDVIVLSLGEAFFDVLPFSFETLPYPDGYHCSDSRGILPLRRKFADHDHRQYEAMIQRAGCGAGDSSTGFGRSARPADQTPLPQTSR